MLNSTRFGTLLPLTPPQADTDILGQANSRTTRRSLEQLLDFSERRTPVGTAVGWTQSRLKECIGIAVRDYKFDVFAAKLIQLCETNDAIDTRFELETSRGRLQAIRSRSGSYSFRFVS